MQKLLFVLGRNPELSLLEIQGYFKAEGISFKISAKQKQSVMIEVEEGFNARERIKDFGGIIKACQVLVEEETPENNFSKLEEKLERIDFTLEFGKKFYYTINDYGTEASEELLGFLLDYFRRKFKSEKLKAMLKWPKEIEGEKKQSISPKILAKRIGTEHLDLFFIQESGKAVIGKTIAVGNPAEFAFRDSQRPVVKHELVISVRLARILTNIAGLEKGKTILDPFCGIGGLMQEFLLSGHNAIGVEQNAENAKACEKNLEWCKRKFNLKQEFKVYNQDSKKISSFLKQGSFQAVVTEPFLGPYLRKLPSTQSAEKTANELSELYVQVFKELAKLMKHGDRVVFIIPEFPTIQGRKVKIQESVFSNQGFKKTFTQGELQVQNPIVYKDSESRIERLIYVLEKS